jgi:hypothetical protein
MGSTVTCDEIRAALLLTMTHSRRPQPTPTLSQHLADCADCQALRSYLFTMLLPGNDEPTTSCAECQEDLAAYVDLSLDLGVRVAAEAYPGSWWHLWSCPTCAELFTYTAALATAERQCALPALPLAHAPAPQRRVIGRLALAPGVVGRMMQTRALLGRAYGGEEDLVLNEAEANGYSFQLSLQHEPEGTWEILVSVIPPVVGQAVIRVGATVFHAPFDPLGIAHVSGVPTALFRDGQPAVSVTIEAA